MKSQVWEAKSQSLASSTRRSNRGNGAGSSFLFTARCTRRCQTLEKSGLSYQHPSDNSNER